MNRRLVALITICALCLAAAAPACAQPIAGAQEVLTAFGTLCGAELYSSYVSLGSVIDCWSRDVYPRGQAVSLVGTLRIVMEEAAGTVDAVAMLGLLEGEDQIYLAKIVAAYALLDAQARSFAAWAESGEKGTYDGDREAAWEMVASVLGLSEAASE